MKILFVFFCIFLVAFSGCKGKQLTNNTQIVPVEVSEEQLYEIYSHIYATGDTNFMKGRFSNIEQLTSNNQLIPVEIGDKTESSGYYYNAFKFEDNNLIVIYDDTDDRKTVCGCIYYNEVVSSANLSKANTYEDVIKFDTAVESDPLWMSAVSADVLISRKQYDTKNPLLDSDKTLHFCEDGLYIVQYETFLGELSPAELKIASIEKIDDMVFNAVYEALIKISL